MRKLEKLKEKLNMRNTIIFILCITLIIMTFGFILISMKLKSLQPKYDVSFTEVNENYSVKGGSIEPTFDYKLLKSNTEIKLEFNLNTNYDQLSYRITVSNNGNMPAKIVDVVEKNNINKNFIDINYNDITDTVLEPGETIDININASYINSISKSIKTDYTLCLITKSV